MSIRVTREEFEGTAGRVRGLSIAAQEIKQMAIDMFTSEYNDEETKIRAETLKTAWLHLESLANEQARLLGDLEMLEENE